MICAYMTLKETSQAAMLTEVAGDEIPDRMARGLWRVTLTPTIVRSKGRNGDFSSE